MKEKILKLVTVITVIITLTSLNIIFLGYNMVIALANGLENNHTNIADVKFDAYFKVDNQNVYTRTANISDEQIYLYINVNVLEKGSVNNAKIKINDANFKIKDGEQSSTYVKNINIEENEIELNSIIYNNNVELEIPIEFHKEEYINAEYFSKESTITLEGTYKEEEAEESLSGHVTTKLEWTDNAEIEMSQSIEKSIDLGENGLLVQQNITTTVKNGMLPRENESLNIKVPKIGDTLPREIEVLLNGKKLDENLIEYNEENGQLLINQEMLINGEGKTTWDNGADAYKIIYVYDKAVKENLDTIQLHTEINSKLFTKESTTKLGEQENDMEFHGNVVSVDKTTTQELYKGYLYANSTNETIYKENNVIEISNAESINSIKASTTHSYFIGNEEAQYDANAISLYKETYINKNKFVELFGENGYIYIKDTNGSIIKTINNDTETNEDGNIQITYEQPLAGIVIETSKPVEEGQFTIHHVKYIQGNTGYQKSELKTFTAFSTNEIVETNLGTEEVQATIQLLDTKTEARLEMSNTNLSTLQENKNVQFLIVLKSSSEQYDLYKNPQIDITIPKEIDIHPKTISQLNAQDELQISMTGMRELDNGDKVIRITLEGEQTNFANTINDGIQIAFMADLNIDQTTPSQNSKISMTYTNENRENETFTYEEDIKINSKYGVLYTNQFTGYNGQNDTINGMDTGVISGKLDTNAEEKNATQTMHIINNYEEEITNVSILGKIPSIEEETINDTTLKSTFEMNLLNTIHLNGKEGTIYYSEDANATVDSDTWTENYEDVSKVRAFKIQIDSIATGESIEVGYQVNIPANLQANAETYIKNTIQYTYLGNNSQILSVIKLETEKTNTDTPTDPDEEIPGDGNLVEDEDISVNIVAKTGDTYLKDGDTVKEGQGITYELQVTNKTDTQLNHIQIEATNANAIYYDLITYEDDINGEMMELTKIDENPELTSKQLSIDTLEPGETKTVSYQISVKEVEEENQTTAGEIKIQAEGLDEKVFSNMENVIETGDLKLTIRNLFSEDIDIYSRYGLPVRMYIENISGNTLENVIVEVPVCDALYFVLDNTYIASEETCEFLEYTDKVARFQISKMEPNETTYIQTQFIAEDMDKSLTEALARQYFTASVNDQTYISNELQKTIYQSETTITMEQTSNVEGDTVYDGDNIQFKIHMKNEGAIEKDILVSDNIQTGLIINRIYIVEDGQERDIQEYNRLVSERIYLSPGEEVDLIIDTTLDASLVEGNTVENYATGVGNNVDEQTNILTYTIGTKEEPEDPDNPEDPDDPDDPDNPEDPNRPEDPEKQYTISGQAWLDENENGQKDANEPKLSNIIVMLIDEETGLLVENDAGNTLTTQTDGNGAYTFEELPAGKYMVLFQYDTNRYTITEYRKDGVSEISNSDIISKKVTINNEEITVAATETLEIVSNNLTNIDAGFINGRTFDLRLDKYISTIIVQNNAGTITRGYNEQNLVKIELDAKQLASSRVIIEYQIRITNEGDMPGYANEIIDYIPSDLDFSSEINKDWYQTTDGNISTKVLENEILNPGETKIITLTLTKNMTQDNTGNVINTAEIKQSDNDYALQDIDSVAGNRQDGEDDISTAELIISIRTGSTVLYISLIFAIIVIIGVGVYFINKKVLGKQENI